MSLYDAVDQLPFPARATDPDTSKRAAKIVRPKRGNQAHRVLAAASYLDTFTDPALIARLGRFDRRDDPMKPGTVIKRRGDLVTLGLVKDTGRRAEVDGSKRIVWQITLAGYRMLDTLRHKVEDVPDPGRRLS